MLPSSVFSRTVSGFLACAGILISADPDHSLIEPARPLVTIAHLRHKIPRAAVKEFRNGTKALLQDDYEGAIAALRKAVAADPAMTDARNNLAVALMEQGELDQAAAECYSALGIDAEEPVLYFNLGLVFYRQRRFQKAELSLRQAMARETPPGSKTLLLLAVSIAAQGKLTAEIQELLRQAEEEYPIAHIVLAECLAKEGDKPAAKREVEEYLETGDPTYARAAKVMLVLYGSK